MVFLAFVLPLTIVISAIINEIVALSQWTTQAGAKGLPPPAFLSHLPFADHIVGWWTANLTGPDALRHLSHSSSAVALLPSGSGGRLVGGLIHRIPLVSVMLLTLFFLLRDGERLMGGCGSAASTPWEPPANM